MMRIGYILSTFPCPSERFAAREIAELQKQGFAVTVLAAAGSPTQQIGVRAVYRPPRLSADALVSVAYLLVRYPLGLFRLLRLVTAFLAECPREAMSVIGNLHTIAFFVRRLDQARLDHVHAYFLNWPACIGLALSAVTGKSVSLAAHARDVFVEHGAVRLKIAQATFVVACTRQAADYLKNRVPAVDRHKLLVNYHGVTIQAPADRASATGVLGSNHDYRVACLGRLIPKKGCVHLVRAFALLTARWPHGRLIIAGSGPERERIRYRIGRLGLTDRVELRPWQPADAARELIEKAHLLVVPSVVAEDGDRDGIPNVILEAFAAGIPVVASRLEGIAEAVVHRHNGILVDPGDVTVLASAMEELLTAPRRREAMGRAAYETARARFDVTRNVHQLAELFRNGHVTP